MKTDRSEIIRSWNKFQDRAYARPGFDVFFDICNKAGRYFLKKVLLQRFLPGINSKRPGDFTYCLFGFKNKKIKFRLI